MWLKPCSRNVVLLSSVLLHPRVAVVEQAKTRPAVPVSHSADGDSGLLEHLVQCCFFNGCWRDALLVCQRLQLPVRKSEKSCSGFVKLWACKASPFTSQQLGMN